MPDNLSPNGHRSYIYHFPVVHALLGRLAMKSFQPFDWEKAESNLNVYMKSCKETFFWSCGVPKYMYQSMLAHILQKKGFNFMMIPNLKIYLGEIALFYHHESSFWIQTKLSS